MERRGGVGLPSGGGAILVCGGYILVRVDVWG